MKTTIKLFLTLFMIGLIWACTDDTNQLFDDPNSSSISIDGTSDVLQFSVDPLVDPEIIVGDNKGGNVTCEEAAAAADFLAEGEVFEFTTGKVDYEIEVDDDVLDFEASFGDFDVTVTDGTWVSWSFTPPDGYCGLMNLAVIVKGGKGANVYFYDAKDLAGLEDVGLSAPVNSSGESAGLSNLTFCYNLKECCTEWIVYGSNLNAGTDDFDDAIYAYDLNAKKQTLVYDPTPVDDDQNYPNANAYDPDNQRIYCGTKDGDFFYYDIDDVIWQQLTTNENFGTMACGAWYDGLFYYVENGTNNLYKVSINESNEATREFVGDVPTSNGYGDIAFDPENPGVFIASAGAPTAVWFWYNVEDNTSGTLARSGGVAKHLQLAYGSDGVLYGVEAISGQFYTIVYDKETVPATVTLTEYWDSEYTFTDLASGPQCQ